MRKFLLLIAALATLGAIAAAPAGAADYTEDGTVISGGDTTFAPGGDISIISYDWETGQPVQIYVFSEPTLLATVDADASGAVSTSVTLPDTLEPGAHTLQLTGTGADGNPRTVEQAITVTASGATDSDSAADATSTSDGDLASTGTNSTTIALVAAGMVAAGAVIMVARKRRGVTA